MSWVTGTLTFFQEEKLFGFVRQEGLDKDIFVHFDKGVEFYCNGGEDPAMRPMGKGNVPKRGDLIVLSVVEVKKGPAARWWGLASEFQLVLEDIANRPLYRLKQTSGYLKSRLDYGSATYRENVKWEGVDITKCPATFLTQRKKDGSFMSDNRTFFEAFNPSTNTWTMVDFDPRVKYVPVFELFAEEVVNG